MLRRVNRGGASWPNWSPPRTDPGVYAFVVHGAVKYIGLTKMGFARRMYSYSRPGIAQRTSQRINGMICEHCRAGDVVEIYVAVSQALEWNDLPIHTAAGLEAGLIDILHPSWNKMALLDDRV